MSRRWDEPDIPDRDRVVLRLLNLPAAPERVARYLDMARSAVCERAADLEVDNEMLMHANARLIRERDEAREAAVRHRARVEELEAEMEAGFEEHPSPAWQGSPTPFREGLLRCVCYVGAAYLLCKFAWLIARLAEGGS